MKWHKPGGLTVTVSVVGCQQLDGEKEEGVEMEVESEMKVRKESWGRLTCSIPMFAKYKIMEWQRKSGMRKAEFLRSAILIGAVQMANQTGAKSPEDRYMKGGEKQ
jgi:hypothetical protein